MTTPSDDIAARGSYALALYEQGRAAEALTFAWQTAGAHPNSPLAQYTYASLLRESGREREALPVIDAALRLHPASADGWVLRGDLQQVLAGVRAAEPDYLRALQIDPNHGLATHNLAVSRLRWGTNTAALRGLVRSVQLDPALGSTALGNIVLALTRVLRLATAAVVFPAVALTGMAALHEDGQSSSAARIIAVVLTVPLIVALIWVVREVRAPWLRAVLRHKPVLGLRLGFLCFAVLLTLVAAAVGSAVAVAGPLLLLGLVMLTVLGWVFGG